MKSARALGIVFFVIGHFNVSAQDSAIKSLKKNKHWRALLHYVNDVDLEKELKRTLKLFQSEKTVQKAKCRYLARYEFLKEHYKLLETAPCEEFEEWEKHYELKNVSLVFASQFFSDPASILGHSFLLLESARFERNLQITVNYAAKTPEDVGLFEYVYKGLTGGFFGHFSLLPFFDRVNLYNIFELRDLWIYRLNFTKKEKHLFTRHLWEVMQNAKLPYYFFDENCATMIVNLLKAVRPLADMGEGPPWTVVPLEVIAGLHKTNWFDKVDYLPSLARELEARKKTPSEDLDIQITSMRLKKSLKRNEWSEDDEKKWRELLVQRSKKEVARPLKVQTKNLAPHMANPSRFFALGHNVDEQLLIGLRYGFHDFHDTSIGYGENNQLILLSPFFSYHTENKKIRFENITIGKVVNYRSFGDQENPLSWSLEASIKKTEFENDKKNYYGLLQADFGVGQAFFYEHLFLASFFRLGAKPGNTGIREHWDLGPKVEARLTYSHFKAGLSYHFAWPDEENLWEWNGSVNLGKKWVVVAKLMQNKHDKFDQFDKGELLLRYQF
jgi:hypothetical protein